MNKQDDLHPGRRNRHKALKKIIKISGNVLFAVIILIVAVVVFFVFQSRIPGVTPGIAGYRLYIVLSGSMEPALHTGSLVLVHSVNVDSLAVNDIITFKDFDGTDKLITHRIVAINSGEQLSFSTRGDANNVNDYKTIPASDVVGKVRLTLPYVGYLMDFARSKLGILVLVIIPGSLIALFEMWKLLKFAIQLDRERQGKIRAEVEKKADAERGEASANKL